MADTLPIKQTPEPSISLWYTTYQHPIQTLLRRNLEGVADHVTRYQIIRDEFSF